MTSEEMDFLAEIAEAAPWVAKALTGSGYRADFSVESLHEIDRFFDEQAEDGEPRPGGLLAKSLNTRMFALGAYLGEVVRRQVGGTWEATSRDPEDAFDVMLRLPSGEVVYPMHRVWKRLQNGPEDGVFVYGFVLTRSDAG